VTRRGGGRRRPGEPIEGLSRPVRYSAGAGGAARRSAALARPSAPLARSPAARRAGAGAQGSSGEAAAAAVAEVVGAMRRRRGVAGVQAEGCAALRLILARRGGGAGQSRRPSRGDLARDGDWEERRKGSDDEANGSNSDGDDAAVERRHRIRPFRSPRGPRAPRAGAVRAAVLAAVLQGGAFDAVVAAAAAHPRHARVQVTATEP